MGRYPPQGHKLPAALGKMVITCRWLPAVRTASLDAATWRRCNRDLQLVVFKCAHPQVLINKPDEGLHFIQDGIKVYLNSWRSLFDRFVA